MNLEPKLLHEIADTLTTMAILIDCLDEQKRYCGPNFVSDVRKLELKILEATKNSNG